MAIYIYIYSKSANITSHSIAHNAWCIYTDTFNHKYKCLQPKTHTKASANTHNDQAPHPYMKFDDSCG